MATIVLIFAAIQIAAGMFIFLWSGSAAVQIMATILFAGGMIQYAIGCLIDTVAKTLPRR